MCLTESVPWQVLQLNDGSNYSLRSVVWISNEFGEIFHQLTKIADWLFSFQGCEALASCRNVLEELGLISWREETGCVHIHGLTLEGVRRMLSENHISLYKLLSSLEYKTPTPDVEVRLATSKM